MGFDIFYLLVGAIVAAVPFFFCSVPALGILQQCGYSSTELNAWYFRKGNMLKQRYLLLALACVLLTALFSLCFSFLGATVSNLISATGLLGMCILFVYSKRFALKVPFKRTPRAVRLGVCYYILLVAVIFSACVGLWYAAEAIGHDLARIFRFVPVVILPVFFPVLLSLAGLVMKAYEVPRNRKIVKRAAKKLHESPCVKVGITGSFGKTSVKYYAATILSRKFRVISTPSSYNTPLGIARTVNELGLDCDVFLAEMGARHTGDIRELCEIVPVDYAVITGIGNQHLETFGSLEAIAREKGELATYAKVTVLGVTAKGVEAEQARREGESFAAENVVCTVDGTRFDLRLNGKTIAVETKLLGRHAAQDVALAAALCSELGMTVEEIAAGIAAIEPVDHRLQKILSNGLTILDDSYNSNAEGAKNAVEVLKLFPGKRCVVTPGLVELGEMEEAGNAVLGASLVGLDRIILVGETLVHAVSGGYERAGGDKTKLTVVPTLQEACKILQEEFGAGDCVLFLNDLPDRY